MDVDTLLGVVVGGVVALSSTIVVDLLRARREKALRWDPHGFETIREYLTAANQAIGALHDRGSARNKYGPESERFRLRNSEARVAYDRLRIARSCAVVANQRLKPELKSSFEAFEILKSFVEGGFDAGDPEWNAKLDPVLGCLDQLSDSAAALYGVRGS